MSGTQETSVAPKTLIIKKMFNHLVFKTALDD